MSSARYLDVGPDQWWHESAGERLRMEVESMEPGVDEDGSVAWVTVEGVRILPDGQRHRVRVLVRAEAVSDEDS